jgi:hypothetical protein
MLKYVSKLAMDILPSVVATIVGAYIVNHYIVTKPGADAPVATAVSPADPKKADARSTDVANLPAAGVRAKGISEKAIFDKSAAAVKQTEKPQEKSAEKSIEKSAEKSLEPSEDKPAETASIPVETRSRPAVPREKEKTAIRTIPLGAPTMQPAASAVVAPNPAPAVEAAITPDDRRDANDLARAAIERLRGSNGGSPRTQETTRTPESPRVVAAPQTPAASVSAPAIRPLPPPIMVSTPPAGTTYGSAAEPSPGQPYSNSARSDDPRRPTPPADIPSARPLDLNAAGPAEPSAREHTNVAQDMLLAAKSMFHSVLPQ